MVAQIKKSWLRDSVRLDIEGSIIVFTLDNIK